ncbi:MAG: hypothetical protein ABIT83_12630 [Massilia sp.]
MGAEVAGQHAEDGSAATKKGQQKEFLKKVPAWPRDISPLQLLITDRTRGGPLNHPASPDLADNRSVVPVVAALIASFIGAVSLRPQGDRLVRHSPLFDVPTMSSASQEHFPYSGTSALAAFIVTVCGSEIALL